MKNVSSLIFLLLCTLFVNAQVYIPKPGEQTGKDFHHQKPKDVEELLKNNQPVRYKSLTTKDNFLMVSNYQNGKRWRYFEGDLIRFKNNNGHYFEEEISHIGDSTFTIYRYNNTSRQLEEYTHSIDNIKSVYKHPRGGVIKTGLIAMSGFIPFALFDWAFYKNNPIENKDFLYITPIVGVGNVLLFKHKTFFNKQKLKNNKSLKIIKPL